METRNLIQKGFIVNNELSPDAIKLIREAEQYFIKAKVKSNDVILGSNYSVYIDKYQQLFPKIKLPSGKPARSNIKNVEEAFKWFFQTYNYTWDTVLKATENYIEEYSKRGYQYMRTSQYFIRKMDINKSWYSELADYCENLDINSNNDIPIINNKVI